MSESRRALLPIAVLLASTALPAGAATEADRIAALEAQLQQQQAAMQQQQRMMEQMQAELQRLKADEAAAPVATTQAVAAAPAPAASAATSGVKASEKKLSMTFYGFAQADAIYDFKRVDPDWADTLRDHHPHAKWCLR
jgi:hypothetical protein